MVGKRIIQSSNGKTPRSKATKPKTAQTKNAKGKSEQTKTAQTKAVKSYRHLTDAACKALLGDKLILACILKSCVREFARCSVHDIETKYIEGEPDIGTIGVHPETTNRNNKTVGRIQGISNEHTSDTEGRVTYDIRFCAITPRKKRVKLIINVEAQNKYHRGYPLVKRGIYYACRQVSAQYGTEFTKARYGRIKKVYSIWICFDPPKKERNTISQYHFTESCIVGHVKRPPESYEITDVVIICLGSKEDENYTGLLKLLDVFTSGDASLQDKSDVLQKEYKTEMPARLREKEDSMCDYSEYIWNKAKKKGKDEGKEEGIKEGRAQSAFQLMTKLKMTIEQALELLSIPEKDWDDYRKLMEQMQAMPAQ